MAPVLDRSTTVSSKKFRSETRNKAALVFGTAIGLTLLLGFWLRCWGLESQSLWADEGYTTWISQFQPKAICRILLRDSGPPLYYIVLHYWSALFGNSEKALRALSALLSTLSLPVFYLVARKTLSNRIALVSATTWYSVSFLQVWYAKEARGYAMLAFLSLASIYCMIRCLERFSLTRLLAAALVISASLYTHNMAWFYLPGLVVFWFVYPSEMEIRARIRGGLIIAAAALLLFLPWLPSFLVQAKIVHRDGFWLPKPTARDLLNTLCILSGVDTTTLTNLFRGHIHVPRLFGYWTWALAFLLFSFVAVIAALYEVRHANRRKSVALLAYALMPVLLVFIESRLSVPLYMNRAFIGPSTLLPLIFCAPIAFQTGMRQKLLRLVVLIVITGTGISAVGYLRGEHKEDWRGATEYLLKLPGRPRAAMIVRDYCQMAIDYYASGMFASYAPIERFGPISRFDPHLEVSPRQRETDPAAVLGKTIGSGAYGEVDLTLQPSVTNAKELTDYLAAHCAHVEVVEFSGVEVRRCFVQTRSNGPVPSASGLAE